MSQLYVEKLKPYKIGMILDDFGCPSVIVGILDIATDLRDYPYLALVPERRLGDYLEHMHSNMQAYGILSVRHANNYVTFATDLKDVCSLIPARDLLDLYQPTDKIRIISDRVSLMQEAMADCLLGSSPFPEHPTYLVDGCVLGVRKSREPTILLTMHNDAYPETGRSLYGIVDLADITPWGSSAMPFPAVKPALQLT